VAAVAVRAAAAVVATAAAATLVVAAAVVAGKSPLRIAQAMREKKARPSPGFFFAPYWA
jgi:hypothetical protein